MTNIYFPDEEIEINDVYFVCYMIERVARKIMQKLYYEFIIMKFVMLLIIITVVLIMNRLM